MKRLFILCSLLLLCGIASIARAAPEPLAVSAYVTAHGTLIVTVFSDAPTSAQIVVQLPANWITDTPVVANIGVSAPTIRTWKVLGPGLGIIRVIVRDARGHVARATAYGEGERPPAAPALVPGWRLWMPLIRR